MNFKRKRDNSFIDFSNKKTMPITIPQPVTIPKPITIPISSESLEPIVYYAVNCHGAYSFSSDNKYETVTIPPSIKNIQKITYSPLGSYNYMDHKDDETVLNTLKKFIPPLYNNDSAYGNDLLDHINNMTLLSTPENRLNNFPKTDDKTGTNYRAGLQEIKKNGIYQSVIYNKENKIPFMNKDYSVDIQDPIQNIYVVFQKGGEFKVGDSILRSNVYEDYVKNVQGYDEEEDSDYKYDVEMLDSISTEVLLELSSIYGYKTVVIIDYSCNICRYYDNKPVSRDHVIKIRQSVNENKLGRGKKKVNKSKRKSKKSKKTKVNKSKKTKVNKSKRK